MTMHDASHSMSSIVLGLGLTGIGRPWGYVNPIVPGEIAARKLLERGFELGVRYYDTAPSYGVSEERLGAFASSITQPERRSITIATKFGEHWNPHSQEPFVDHSFDALRRSLDQSIQRLGSIDILQLHQPSVEILRSDDLARSWLYASSLGVKVLGVSVSDVASARHVLNDAKYELIQVPYNLGYRLFAPVIREAAHRDLAVVVNRPFGMGRLLYEKSASTKAVDAFGFVLQQNFRGTVLSGTKSAIHLEENWWAFQQALHRRELAS